MSIASETPLSNRELARRVRGFTKRRCLLSCGLPMMVVKTGDGDARKRWRSGESLPLVVQGKAGAREVNIRGTWACASRWGCFDCAPAVTARSADELGGTVRLHIEGGGSVLFLTGTFPHDYGDGLQKTFDAAAGAWRAHRSGRAPGELKDYYGYVGYIRAIDLTHGRAHGWHPHVHAVILIEGNLDDAELAALEATMHRKWSAYMVKQGFRSTHKFSLERPRNAGNVAEYVSKVTGHQTEEERARARLAREVVGTGTKQARKGRTITDIYRDAAAHGDPSALLLVDELETVLPRRKLLTWSEYAQDLREEYVASLEAEPDPTEPPDDEDDDDENAAAPLMFVPLWFYCAARQIAGALETLETMGLEAIKYMDLNGYQRHYRVDPFGRVVRELPTGTRLRAVRDELFGERFEYNRLWGQAPSNPHAQVNRILGLHSRALEQRSSAA